MAAAPRAPRSIPNTLSGVVPDATNLSSDKDLVERITGVGFNKTTTKIRK